MLRAQLREKIKREIIQLKRFRRGSVKYKERLRKHEWIYLNWSAELQDCIWDSGYFDLRKWKEFRDLTGGKQRR
jgi:hypothetical protein